VANLGSQSENEWEVEPNKIDFIKELAFDQQKLEKHHEGG
jgi:hypothetical protein